MPKTFLASIIAMALVFSLAGCASGTQPKPNDEAPEQDEAFDQYSTVKTAHDFLGGSAERIAVLVDKAFKDYGSPNAYIQGEEGGGAFAVGLRYGRGELVTKSGDRREIFWQGPSLGFDFGADGGRVFILVYNLPETDAIYQRFAGVAGSAYFVGGVGMNYQKAEDIVIAPIRVGVGMRLGASIGYTHFTREARANPF
ncbi:MAG: DUF1134 domain-containing protein [Halothiobacillaceae bacterium]